MQSLEELHEDFIKKRGAMWDDSELFDKYKREFILAEREFQKAWKAYNKEKETNVRL